MRVAVRRLRVEDVEKLQALVVENFDAIEPGLTVLDARLLLGHATIDVIGTDATGALVLGTVGFSASEEMLLRAVEAFSWCLEYPEAVVRLYPRCQLSEARPPRMLFVVERMPDAFQRKIKQLGLPDVDCVEIRHLEFDGTPTVYFDSLLRLRRTVIPAAVEPEASAPPAGPARPTGANVVTMTRPAAGGTVVERPAPVTPAPAEPVTAPRAAERVTAVRTPAPVASAEGCPDAAPAPQAPRPRPTIEPTVSATPEPLEMADPALALELDPIVASLCEPMAEPPVATATSSEQSAPVVRPVAVEAIPAIAPTHVVTATAPAPERVSVKDLATTLLGETSATHEALADAVVTAMVKPGGGQSSAVGTAAVPAAAPVAPTLEPRAAKPAEQPKPVAPTLPAGFEGLTLPTDGTLTRQWMEFLNQMSATR
jgi:hypothetical protein